MNREKVGRFLYAVVIVPRNSVERRKRIASEREEETTKEGKGAQEDLGSLRDSSWNEPEFEKFEREEFSTLDRETEFN